MRILITICILLMSTSSFGAPFLVCTTLNPDVDGVTKYKVYKDGVFLAESDAKADGSLKLDLAGVTPGAYEWTITAKNVWGIEGPLSDPYVSPGVPSAPIGVGMVE